MRLLRWLPLLLGAVLASWVWFGSRSAAADRPVETRPAQREQDLAAFRAALEQVREADAGSVEEARSLAELGELARRLAQQGRPDARAVLDHYRALTPEGRREGLALERRFETLWTRVEAARADGFDRDEWRVERSEVLYELDALIEDARYAEDRVPLARCLSLRARIGIERAEEDDEITNDTLSAMLDEVRGEAAEADRILERTGFVTPRLEPLWILARVAGRRGEPRAADELYRRCREVAHAVANSTFERHALEGMLRQAHEAGDVRLTRSLLGQLAALGDPATQWTLVGTHADLLIADDDADRAAAWLERHPPDAEHRRWEWRLRLASALMRADRLEEAEAYLRDGTDEAPAELELARALVHLRAGEPARALAAAEQVRTRDQVRPDELEKALWIAGEALLRLGRVPQAIERLEDALAGARFDQARGMQQHRAGIATNVLGERIGLHAVALLAEALVRDGRALEAAAAIERHQGHHLRRELAGTSPVPELGAADLAAWAASMEGGLVTWVVGADASVVVAVAADGTVAGAPIARGRRAIEHAARRLREAILGGDELRADELAAEIETVLFPAEARALIDAAHGRVLCLAHGPIEALALERLPLFADGERIPLCLPSLPEAHPPDRGAWSAPRAWSLCGAPVGADGAELLPGARAELESVARLHPDHTVALGAEFDESRLVEALASGRALHVATHLLPNACGPSGQIAPVGLELARGDVLCAREIADMRPALPLCFLSACQTGGGTFVDAQGLHGVARAFLESGTRDLVVTLWPVEDRAARDFALAWHAALADGALPSECAARARADLRARGYASSEWAAFRALGRH